MSESKARVNCSECDQTFSTRKIQKVHFKWVHEKHEKVECHICKATITNEKYLSHLVFNFNLMW